MGTSPCPVITTYRWHAPSCVQLAGAERFDGRSSGQAHIEHEAMQAQSRQMGRSGRLRRWGGTTSHGQGPTDLKRLVEGSDGTEAIVIDYEHDWPHGRSRSGATPSTPCR
jgi:hypothetical protein